MFCFFDCRIEGRWGRIYKNNTQANNDDDDDDDDDDGGGGGDEEFYELEKLEGLIGGGEDRV